jgi:EAL domain-containing protein (putative c-di-GMP-specific phosphodiesterase class I)
MNNLSKSITFIKEVKKFGIKIALDDFGTGFSSLSYLSFLPIDILKLDRSFIAKFSDKNSKVVKSIIQLGHELNLQIVAEGIETQTQLNAIISMGSEYAQGYYFEKPLPFEEIITKYIDKASNY